MRKIWMSLILLCFLVATAFAQNRPTLSPVDPEFEKYMQQARLKKAPPSTTGQEYPPGYIPSPLNMSHIKGLSIIKKEPPRQLGAFPSAYDLRAQSRLTPVKDQGSCGSCWTFGTFGSLESWILGNGGGTRDFSENNLKECHGFDIGKCSGLLAGGNRDMTTAYLARWGGPINEADDPYVPNDVACNSGLTVQKHIETVLFTPSRTGPSDNDNIKQAIQDYGAMTTDMYYAGGYYNATNSTYYYDGVVGSNHIVAIVGWDDNMVCTGGASSPPLPEPGAWIVRNSWGSTWGDGGYFYVSYYDTVIGYGDNTSFINAVNPGSTIYQYDPLGATGSFGYADNTSWAANIFTPTANENLTSVSTYALTVNTALEIYIYDTFNGTTFSDLLDSKTVTLTYPGYHTIHLDSSIPLTTGDDFAIVIKFTTPGYNFPIPRETVMGGYSSAATASPGQSYVGSNGSTWTDMTTIDANSNVCIKGIAHPSAAPVEANAGSNTSVCSGTCTILSGSATGGTPGYTYSWSPTTSLSNPNIAGPNACPTTTTTYALTVTDDNGCTGTDTVTVTVNSSTVVADFSGTPTTGCVPLAVNFSDLSTGGVLSYLWDFGDGDTSTAISPSHIYNNPGTYTVSLMVSDTCGSDTETKTGYIVVTGQSPEANFIADNTSPCSGTAVQFTAQCTGTVTSYAWDFGDGDTSTDTNPTHTYQTTSSCTVTLTVTGSCGTDTETKTGYITVNGSTVSADFFATTTAGRVPLAVDFSDSSTGDVLSYLWSFGDGDTGTVQSPSHLYNNPGTYTVSLTVSDTCGSDTRTRVGYITVNGSTVSADFSATTTAGCAPLTVDFSDSSTGDVLSYLWNFGDGDTSTAQDPFHPYNNPGTYTVSLTVSDTCGSDTETKTGYITVNGSTVSADFSATTTTGCAPLTVDFADSSTGDVLSYLWSFGDGDTSTAQGPSHLYNNPGTYTVSLTVSDTCGSDTEIKTDYIVVGDTPIANFTADDTSPCSGQVVCFTDQSSNSPTSWSWDLDGDGIPDTTAQDPCWTFHSVGVCTVTLVATNACGSDTETKTGYITVNGSTVSADFSATTTVGCAPLTVGFADSSTGDVLSYLWSFGDGTPDTTIQSPTHIYNIPGTYTVILTVSDTCGSDSETKAGYITVNGSTVSADFSATTVGCAPLTVDFADSSTGDVLSYLWSFGDGAPDTTIQSPTHIYNIPGTYTVSLTVSDTCGSDTETKTGYIVVGDTPTADFTADNQAPCSGTSVQFTANCTGTVDTYSWDFGDGNNSSDSNPSHIYNTTNPCTVTLVVTGACGEDAQTKAGYITVNVSTVSADFSATTAAGCAPLTIDFADSSTGDVTSYLWDFGDGDTSPNSNPVHTYSQSGLYTVVLTVIGQCGSDTESSFIIVGEHVSDVSETTVTSQDGRVRIKFDAEDLGDDGWVVIDQNPEDTTATIPDSYYLLGQTAVGLTVYDSSGKTVDSFDGEVLLVLSYPDKNPEDGIVDKTDPPIDELSLKIYRLEDGQWIEVPGSVVDFDENSVSVSLVHLSIYILIGQTEVTASNRLDGVIVYPNPFKPSKEHVRIIKFDHLTSRATIRIYDIAGELVKKIEEKDGDGLADWDGKNGRGKDVASGVYIYHITNPEGQKCVGKIGIIR